MGGVHALSKSYISIKNLDVTLFRGHGRKPYLSVTQSLKMRSFACGCSPQPPPVCISIINKLLINTIFMFIYIILRSLDCSDQDGRPCTHHRYPNPVLYRARKEVLKATVLACVTSRGQNPEQGLQGSNHERCTHAKASAAPGCSASSALIDTKLCAGVFMLATS